MIKAKWPLFNRMFGCDLRSLAAFRVGIAVIILVDLLNRFSNFHAFHSEFGVFPQNALRELWGGPWFWSLNFVSIGDWWAILLLFLNVIAALALLLGWKTRYATLVCWILQISPQARAPLILQSGDVLLRLLLFWALFLPWGSYYSIDAALEKKPPQKPKFILNWATAGLTLQVLYVYLFGVLLKNGAQWTTEGSAVYYALHIDQFATPLALWMRTLPFEFLRLLNFFVYYFEWLAPLAIIIPWKNGWIRLCFVIGLWCMHLGFGAGLDIGNFVWISIFSTVGLIPSCFWERYTKIPIRGQGVAYYDEDCEFCVRMVEVVKTFLFLPSSIFKPAQSDMAVLKVLEKEDSWVFKNNDGKQFTRAYAFRELIKESPVRFLSFFFFIPGVMFVGNGIYRIIAKKRNSICDPQHKPFQKSDAYFSLSPLESAFCLFTLLFITLWNVGSTPHAPFRWAQKYEGFAYLLRLDQKWEMFSPFPLTDDGWYVIKAVKRNGDLIDPLTNEPPTLVKPLDVRNTYEDFRWRKYMMNIWSAAYSGYRLSYGRYLCRRWNATHSYNDQILTFDLTFMREDTPPPTKPFAEPVPVVVWNHSCFGR